MNRRHLNIAIAIAIGVSTLAGPASRASAHSMANSRATHHLEADTTGSFSLAGDRGQSPVFLVMEQGNGRARSPFRAFTYVAAVTQNLARQPLGCGPNSSTGAQGTATLTFADGTLELRRRSGHTCFVFPFITVDEQWVVASGTGARRGTTGVVERHAVGDVRFGTIEGTLSGELAG